MSVLRYFSVRDRGEHGGSWPLKVVAARRSASRLHPCGRDRIKCGLTPSSSSTWIHCARERLGRCMLRRTRTASIERRPNAAFAARYLCAPTSCSSSPRPAARPSPHGPLVRLCQRASSSPTGVGLDSWPDARWSFCYAIFSLPATVWWMPYWCITGFRVDCSQTILILD